jgi:hypothetical protein
MTTNQLRKGEGWIPAKSGVSIHQIKEYILRQYTSIRHNLLYKAWDDKPCVSMDILYIKLKK